MPQAGVQIVTVDGESTLRTCRTGYAKAHPGAFRCAQCPEGSFVSNTGSLHCRSCPDDTISSPGRTGCGASLLPSGASACCDAAVVVNAMGKVTHDTPRRGCGLRMLPELAC